MIGVQGKRFGMQGLAPLDIVLSIDKSGSMGEPDKMEWVKESLEILTDTLRDDDRLCLTVFDEEGSVVLPSTRIGEGDFRDRFRDAVRGISADGGSNLTAGLRTALDAAAPGAVDSGQRPASRVFLLTDGWGEARGLREVLAEYKEKGIAVTTVGYGQRYDATVVRVITETTEGTSRFIPNREKMEEVFGSGLGRTTVTLAKDIEITVQVPHGHYFRTWGFNHNINYRTKTITYTIPTLHSGDYETILLFTNLLQTPRINPRTVNRVTKAHGPESLEILKTDYGLEEFRTLAHLSATYRDLQGLEHTLEPMEVTVQYGLMENPLNGPSDSRVLLASNLLAYSRLLEEVARMGRDYYYYYHPPHSYFFSTWDMRKQLIDTSRRLSYEGFEDEISVLDNYLHILGENIGLKKSTVNVLISDDEILPLVADRPLDQHLENLFHEMYLSLEAKPLGNIAVAEFDVLSGRDVVIPVYLGEAAGVWLSRLMTAGFQIVERRNLHAVLEEQELALSDLGDEQNAAKVGSFLAADYILTGVVMEMEESVVIFSRIINVETAVIETAAQVIVPKEDVSPQLL
jgi:hypothetical protein